jgi:DNA-binding MarR family transcriptional regulator
MFNMNNRQRKKRVVFEDVNESRPLAQGALGNFLGVKIRLAQQSFRRHFIELLEGMDAAIGEFSTLGLVAANPGLAQIDVAKELDIDKATMVGLIDRLENLGYIERARHQTDRRRYALKLTPQGFKRFEDLQKAITEREKVFNDRYTSAERKDLMSLLDRIID